MEEIVRKELETLKGMVLRWKKSYLRFASPEGGDEFLAEEFSEEIASHISPFVQELYRCKHLNHSEANEFLDDCYSQVEELRDLLRETEAKLRKKEDGHKLVEYSSYGWRK